MGTTPLDDKLTPAAKKTLNEILEDHRQQILVAAASSASLTTGEVREISVNDIVKGVQESFDGYRSRVRTLIERLMVAYVISGLGIALVGLGIFAVQSFQMLDFQRRLPLLIGLGGVIISGLGLAMSYYTKRITLRAERERLLVTSTVGELLGKFQIAWREIEVTLRSLASSRLGESVAQEPISFLVSRLEREKTLPPEDAQRIQQLLAIRNQLAHGQRPLQPSEMLTALREARQLHQRIESYKALA